MKIANNDLNIYKSINPSQGKEKALDSLRVGQTLTMELVHKEGQQGILKFQGQAIKAFLKQGSNYYPAAGSQVTVLVEGFESNQAVLRLVDPVNTVLKQYTVQDIKGMLMESGFSPTEESITIAQKLLQQQLPITKGNIDKILQVMKAFPEKGEIGMNTGIFLMARGLPLQSTLLQVCSCYFQQDMMLGENMQNFLQGIKVMISECTDPEIKQVLTQIQEALETIPISLEDQQIEGKSISTIAKKLMAFLQSYQLDGNERLEQGLTKNLQEIALKLTGDWPEGMKEVIQHFTTQPLVNHRSEQGLPYAYYQIPIRFNEQLETGELFIVPRKKKRKGISKERMQVVFCMDTVELGLLKIDLCIEENNIYAKMGVENEAIRKFVSRYTFLLEEGLKKLHYEVKPIECLVDTQKPFVYVDTLLEVPRDKLDVTI